VTDFGDFDDDDAYDPTQPADPEQVAIKLHEYRYERSLESRLWGQMSEGERVVRIAIVAALLAWMRRQGAL
jgi:hypothetical protein